MTQDKKCSERIYEEMLSREEDIKAMLESDEWGENDPALSIDTKKITTVCFSWGGPADYLEITHDESGIDSVVYRFSDWFDTATRTVEQDSPLYDYARNVLEMIYA
jgi:hypothetical protein